MGMGSSISNADQNYNTLTLADIERQRQQALGMTGNNLTQFSGISSNPGDMSSVYQYLFGG
jgi:hypothetical protein